MKVNHRRFTLWLQWSFERDKYQVYVFVWKFMWKKCVCNKLHVWLPLPILKVVKSPPVISVYLLTVFSIMMSIFLGCFKDDCALSIKLCRSHWHPITFTRTKTVDWLLRARYWKKEFWIIDNWYQYLLLIKEEL